MSNCTDGTKVEQTENQDQERGSIYTCSQIDLAANGKPRYRFTRDDKIIEISELDPAKPLDRNRAYKQLVKHGYPRDQFDQEMVAEAERRLSPEPEPEKHTEPEWRIVFHGKDQGREGVAVYHNGKQVDYTSIILDSVEDIPEASAYLAQNGLPVEVSETLMREYVTKRDTPSEYTCRVSDDIRNGKVTVEFRKYDETINALEFNPKNDRERDRIYKLIEESGYPKDQFYREMVEITKSMQDVSPSVDHSEEVDQQSIVRPERIIRPGLSAVAVPILSPSSHGISGRWVLYVATATDRFTVPLTSVIKLSETRYYVSPVPSEPMVTDKCRWSKASRESWLGGASVSPAEAFKLVARAIDNHVELEAEYRHGYLATLTCWVLLSYVYHAWDAVPYLLLQGPAGSGKSTLFGILERLCFNAELTTNPSASSIFRQVNCSGSVYLFDEAERLKDTRSPDMVEINNMLLAGYKRCGVVIRNETFFGNTWKPVPYSVFCPKAVGGINGVLAPLQSRCIEIRTQKAGKDSPKPRRKMIETDWQGVRDSLYVCCLSNPDIWLAAADRECTEVHGRDAELWGPLLAIASVVENDGVEGLVELLAATAKKSVAESADLRTPEADQVLLSVLVEALREGIRVQIDGSWQTVYQPSSSELLSACQERARATFEKWSPQGIGARLRNYGLNAVKSNGRREYRGPLARVIEVAERYSIEV